MAVTLFCPSLRCRSILQVPESARGKKVRCGNCGTTFIVPKDTGTPDKPPSQPQPSNEQQ